MPLFRRRHAGSAGRSLDELAGHVESLRAQLLATSSERDELHQRLAALEAVLGPTRTPPHAVASAEAKTPTTTAPPPQPGVSLAEVNERTITTLRDIASQQAALEQLRADIDAMNALDREAWTRIDARLAEVTQQFSNQFLELGNEIDHALSRHPSATDLGLDELRAAQERLAAEQARYQIAFRQDLARLADDLRRRGLT
jgi:hypothetical protein